MAQAEIKAVITAEDKASAVVGNFGNSFGKLAGAMAVGQLAADALSMAIGKVVDLTKASVGAAFNQVREVQNATFALKAYEGNAEKVNAVLKDLVSFARSDMGTLFKREELFSAAQTLKIFGQSTETLSDKVKILAKGSASAGAPIQELAMIIGRAAAKGRLDAVDFDMLIERGVGLDRSMRGAAVTSESLFQALDKALPASLLEGRANTIDGAMIKLESGFRDLGSSILGVDKDTSQFIKGGLGDTAMGILKEFTEWIKKPEIKLALENIGKGLAGIGQGALDGLKWAWDTIIKPFFEWIKEIAANPEVQAIFKSIWETMSNALTVLWNVLSTQLWPALKELWKALEPYAPYIGMVLLAALTLFVGGIILAAIVIATLITWVINAWTWFNNLHKTIYEAGRAAGEQFKKAIENAINGIKGFVSNLYNIGKDFIEGIINGIKDNGGRVIEAIKNIAKGALDQVKKFFGISSPSKVMAEQGGFIIQGLAKGLEGNAGVVDKAIQGINTDLNANITPNVMSNGNVAQSSVNSRAASNTTININVGLMTGSAIERREAAAMMFEDLKVIASQQGQSVGQMIGAS